MTTPPPFIFGEYKPSLHQSTRSPSSSDSPEQPTPSGMASHPIGMASHPIGPGGAEEYDSDATVDYHSDATVDYDSDAAVEYTQEDVNVLVVITTHGSTITRDSDKAPSKFLSTIELIKVDMVQEGTSCYTIPGKDLITPLTRIEGDFYKSNPDYDPVDLAEACAEYTKKTPLILDTGDKQSLNDLRKVIKKDKSLHIYTRHYDNTGRITSTIPGDPIPNKIYKLSYHEFTSHYCRRFNVFTVNVSFNGKNVDLLSPDSDFLFGEFLGRYGNFTNPMYDSGNIIYFESVSFYLEDIMEFLSHRTTDVLIGLLKPHQTVGSITMVDMTCSETLTRETPRHVRGVRYGMNRQASIQARSRKNKKKAEKKKAAILAEEEETSQELSQGLAKKTKRGGQPRGRKTRGRKSRGRKTRGRR